MAQVRFGGPDSKPRSQRRPSLPYYDGGIYLLPDSDPIWSPDELVELKNDPAYNEAWPRALVPYSAVHGVVEPATLPWLPNNGALHAELPAGTPFGLIGTSSFLRRPIKLDHTSTFTDTETGAVKIYDNPRGTFGSKGDTEAFPPFEGVFDTCPTRHPGRSISYNESHTATWIDA